MIWGKKGVFHFFALRVDSPLFFPLGGVRGKEWEKRKNEMPLLNMNNTKRF